MNGRTGRRIERVHFLIHPVCWAEGCPNGRVAGHILREDEFLANLVLERRIRAKQNELIETMDDRDVLILYPIGQGTEMQELERFAKTRLGDRCLILRRAPPQRSDYERYLPREILADLSLEVMRAYVEFGYAWLPKAIKVLYVNRAYALDIEEELRQRGLVIDPATVVADAFGEGFEACAMTWKGMLAHYLGWAHPIENRYELSVSGAPFLVHADFRERVALRDDIRLFLWTSSHGRQIGFYARAGFRMHDHQRFARLPTNDLPVEIWTGGAERRWPVRGAEALSVKPEVGSIAVAVYEGGCKLPTDEALYLISEPDVPYDQFAALLKNADITGI